MSTTFLLSLLGILAAVAYLATRNSGPRITTVERKREEQDEDRDA